MNSVNHRRKREFAEHREPSARTTNRLSGCDVPIQGVLYGRVLPEANVVRLIAPRDENRLSLVDSFDELWIIGVITFGKDDGRSGVQRAESADLFIYFLSVIVLSVGAENQEIAAIC